MGLVTAFRDLIAAAVIGGAFTPYNNANAQIGVGDGTTAFANTQTALVGPSISWKAMDAGYPTISANVLTFRSTFAGADANHAWNEWGIRNGATALVLMNRVVQANGTKASTETKVFTATVTLGI